MVCNKEVLVEGRLFVSLLPSHQITGHKPHPPRQHTDTAPLGSTALDVVLLPSSCPDSIPSLHIVPVLLVGSLCKRIHEVW